jgi:hypothetical protein
LRPINTDSGGFDGLKTRSNDLAVGLFGFDEFLKFNESKRCRRWWVSVSKLPGKGMGLLGEPAQG